ncbi:hypothetical protein ILUMI_21227 [Ignelater luminosus]|uniref:Major facilitator superfamily (MFS) profile domain-containing protein n=1 Tax=Ignelater luminosus TaxID=2038154 RepID=A0A8K0CJA4_IGNLU|nr:hypothetical protein ILUMI_21227 [Ignelater luminosus]
MKITVNFFKRNAAGNNIFQYVAMLTATLSAISSGMHYGWPSPSLPQLLADDSEIPVTDDEGSWVAVMPLLGAIVGAIISGIILDILGRKNVILISCIPYITAWLMIAFTKSVVVILSARFIAGISDGFAFCALPMYLGEIAAPKVRGALGSSVSVTWIFGILLINIIGSYLSIKVTALVSLALPVLCLVTFIWMPESPYYLIMKGNIEQARKNLKTFRCADDVESDLERMSRGVKEQHDNTGKYLDLFTVKSNRKALGIALVLRGAQQLSGTAAITFYAQVIFEEAGSSGAISASEASMIFFAVQLSLCVLTSTIVDKAGRRPLLIISIIGASLALFVEGSYFLVLNEFDVNLDSFTWIPLVALVGYVVAFSLGMQTIPIMMLGEMFPTNVKAFALCVVDIYFGIIATIVSKFFQITKDNFGLHVPFYSFVLCCILGLIFIIFFVLETKGKTLEQIQKELKGGDSEDDNRIEEQREEY